MLSQGNDCQDARNTKGFVSVCRMKVVRTAVIKGLMSRRVCRAERRNCICIQPILPYDYKCGFDFGTTELILTFIGSETSCSNQ